MTFIDAGSSAVRRLHRGLARLTDPAGPDPTSSSGERAEAVATILAAADARDAISDARDAAAEERERQIDLSEMLAVDHTYGDHWAERRDATLDRLHAREDRRAAREDRLALARIQDRTSS